MKFPRRLITLVAALSLSTLALPAVAKDFGDATDVKQVRKMVAAKFGKALHASVSHDWALCTAYSDESDLTVLLKRTASAWTIVRHDGGAYAAENLKSLGVPQADIAPLLKAYQ
jgi:hypothetical protein